MGSSCFFRTRENRRPPGLRTPGAGEAAIFTALLDREKLALAERELRGLPEELREELWLREPEPEALPL
jgi:hypothetical protein